MFQFENTQPHLLCIDLSLQLKIVCIQRAAVRTSVTIHDQNHIGYLRHRLNKSALELSSNCMVICMVNCSQHMFWRMFLENGILRLQPTPLTPQIGMCLVSKLYNRKCCIFF